MSISFLPEIANKFNMGVNGIREMRKTWTDERIEKMDYLDTLTMLRTVNEQFFVETGVWQCPRDENGQPMKTRVSVLAIGGGGGGAEKSGFGPGSWTKGFPGGDSSFGGLVVANGGDAGESRPEELALLAMPFIFHGDLPFMGIGTGGGGSYYLACGKSGRVAAWHGLVDEDQTVIVGAGGGKRYPIRLPGAKRRD